ncbi:hypothetical protein Q8F55_004750 [Vanrija albida]|uniref:Carboxylesterase type B domain-containing protein n=1 Tax=Vanrija albida TaxID=181172 RepID=A0ABR3PZZ0_9TREE
MPQPTLSLTQGTYAGALEAEGGAEAFRGIPYAHTTRLHPPVPVHTDTRASPIDATRQGPTAIAPRSRLEAVMGRESDAGPQSEDAAVLSVYRPPLAHALPILFWIHGGGFSSGSSQASQYDGGRLARDAHAVVVCANYRLGLLGFIYDPEPSHQPTPAEAFGVQDLTAALEWVASNAGALGGDAGNITVLGQSAGGLLTAELLVLHPQLVARAIVQSSVANLLASVPQALAIRDVAASLVPAGQTLATITPEQALSVQAETAAALPALGLDLGPGFPFFPVLPPAAGPGGARSNPNPDVAPSSARPPVLVTYAANDGYMYGLAARAAGLREAEVEALPATALRTNAAWATASTDYAQFLRARGHAVALAEFVWRPRGSEFGAVHTIDVPLLFGTRAAWAGAPMLGGESWDEVDARGREVRRAWGGFARGVWPETIDGVLEVLEAA